tara:strand:+ start:10078 stop:10296 length:219 start_codon:yes stop_codon:yes gene_type:complete
MKRNIMKTSIENVTSIKIREPEQWREGSDDTFWSRDIHVSTENGDIFCLTLYSNGGDEEGEGAPVHFSGYIV